MGQLTHNEIGPHNPSFYKLLGELEEEYYELKRKGYTGRFVPHLSHRSPVHSPAISLWHTLLVSQSSQAQEKASTRQGTISPASNAPNTTAAAPVS